MWRIRRNLGFVSFFPLGRILGMRGIFRNLEGVFLLDILCRIRLIALFLRILFVGLLCSLVDRRSGNLVLFALCTFPGLFGIRFLTVIIGMVGFVVVVVNLLRLGNCPKFGLPFILLNIYNAVKDLYLNWKLIF